MATQTNIYDALKKDHKAVKQILEDMVSSGPTEKVRRQELVSKLMQEFLAHSHAEERLLYKELEQHKKSHDIALEGEEEHHVTENLLKELAGTDPADDHWQAKATVLKELIEHHVEEEEEELFTKAREVLGDDEAVDLAQRFKQEKQQEMKRL